MVETGAGADRLLVAQSQEASPADRVTLAEVDPGTARRTVTGQLTAQQRVSR